MKEIIEVKNLDYSYPDGTRAIRGIDLNIKEGESIGLIGHNGAGKSTFLLHLNGILKSNGKSKISVLGQEITRNNLDYIRSKVGLVFQDPEDQLFMPTVFDNVAFGPINNGANKTKVQEFVKTALEEVDMEDAAQRCAHHLSFGEKKRVALATVLSMDIEILVLDEPTSNLDPQARRHLIQVLNNLKITKIIAGHDMEMILEVCDRVIVLNKGKIAADGKPHKILSNSQIMEANGLEVPVSLKIRSEKEEITI